jgi:Amt family ammonium transporter
LFAQESIPLAQVFLDNTFVFVAGILVIFMQIGFALVEAGLTRAKSVSNIMMKNMMDFCGGAIMFFLIGYSLAYGPDGNDFIGWGDWALSGIGGFDPGALVEGDYTISGPVDFFFQLAFAAAAATIVSGAMAERTKFKSYFIYSLVITGVIYPIVVHWTWGGGWLSQFGDGLWTDFAGSSIVHMTGGLAALAGAAVLGPRIGKYGPDGKPRAILGHNIPFAVVGALILLIGWYGFNPGSNLAATFPEVGDIAITTTLSAVAGAIAAMAVIWMKTGKPDVAMTANGLLAGLVGITAGTAAVGYWGALGIGLLSGIAVVFSVLFLDRVKIDDPVGAVSVHGTCGGLGTLLVGVFAMDGGLLAGDGANLLWHQLVGVVAIAAFVLVTAFALFLAIKATVGLRVSPEEEMEGLDILEHGAPGYNEDTASGPVGVTA